MKKTVLILIFGSVLSLCHAQTKADKTLPLFMPKPALLFLKPAVLSTPALPHKIMNLDYQAPKLPFFCSMEDKFRAKFHVFLKLRAGDDDAYEKLIRNSAH